MQPGLPLRIVATTVNGFVDDVGVMAPKTIHLLMQPVLNASHEVLVTSIPELVTMREVTLHSHAGCFNDVLAKWLGIYGRQVAVPKNDLAVVGSAHN